MRGAPDRWKGAGLWTMLLAGAVASVWITGFTPDKMKTWGNATLLLAEMFPPDWSVLPTVMRGMAETVGIAFLGTLLGAVIAFPVSFVMARNIGQRWMGMLLRGIMSFLRSVPEVIWAMLFVVATEFGNVPGVFALATHNIGILAKLYGEVFEAAPVGTQEAMAATGASRANTVWFGIIPWSVPGLLSHSFFRFECNIRTATILGVVGAGGIGRELMLHRQLFQYDAMMVDTLGILALVVLADWLGAFIRKQVT